MVKITPSPKAIGKIVANETFDNFEIIDDKALDLLEEFKINGEQFLSAIKNCEHKKNGFLSMENEEKQF